MWETIRKFIVAFDTIERFVPKKGTILDVGCGHGIFSEILAKGSKERKVTGIDPSSNKIAKARERIANTSNLQFATSYLSDYKGKNFDCITIVDVLYLLPTIEKEKLIREAYKRLKRGGVLIVKEVAKNENLFVQKLVAFEEMLMIRVLKLTHSDFKDVYFITQASLKSLLTKNGFKVTSIHTFKSRITPHKHTLFVAIKIAQHT